MVAATQAQRAALYTNLVDLMGQEAADSLMDELPPGGWYQLATKDDLAGTELRLQAAFTAAMAQINAKFAENHVKFAETNATVSMNQSRVSASAQTTSATCWRFCTSRYPMERWSFMPCPCGPRSRHC